MYPFLFGQEWLDMFVVMIGLGLIFCFVLFRINCTKLSIPVGVYNFYLTSLVISTVSGFLFAYLFQQLYNAIDAAINHTQYIAGGITFMGGLIGGVATFLIITIIAANRQEKKDGTRDIKDYFWQIANITVPSILIAHAFGRLGCLCAGCCHGKETTSALGFMFPTHYDNGVATQYTNYYPTQLYESLFLFLMFGVTMLLLYKFKKHEILLSVYAISYSIFRFLIEFLRGDERGAFIPGLSPSQMQSIILLLVGIAILVMIYKFKYIPFKKKTPPKTQPNPDLPQNE